jgi:hypothetical protein
MSSALDRNALYYPYIHVRDVNWLKATLLCFRQVRRMVPPDFHLNDLPELKPYRALAPGTSCFRLVRRNDFEISYRDIEENVRNRLNFDAG